MMFETQKEFVIYAGETARELSKTECSHVQKQMARAIGQLIANDIGQKDRSPHTLKNWITSVRNEFDLNYDGDIGLKKAFLDGCRLPEHLLAEVMGRADERRQERAYNQRSITSAQATAILDGIAEWYCAEDVTDPVHLAKNRFAYGIAMSGRRPIEMRAKNFSAIEGRVGQTPAVLFSGQAKMRGAPNDPYDIPLLCGSEKFLDIVWCVGSGFTAVEMRPIFDSMLDHLSDWPDDLKLSAKSLRAFYACASYHLFAPEGRQKWHWINEVLGHEPDDMSTCQTYDLFKIG